MRHPALLPATLFVAALTLAATPVAAQYYGYPSRDYDRDYGHDRTNRGWSSATADWRSQLDRPGDYRCDAFWDASRTDCAAPWRDQRRSRGYGWNGSGYGQAGYSYSGYGYRNSNYGHAAYNGGRNGYSSRRRGYGQVPFDQAGAHNGGEAWHGAYGRPDLVYGDNNSRGRDARRISWCRSNYRSYDPASGYYRAYSGRLVYCG